MTDKEMLKNLHTALDDKMGVDIKMLDISKISSLGEYFILVSGNNENHLKALADAAGEVLHKAGFKIRHSEGYNSSNWILLDFSFVIVHIFDKEARDFYNLERIWTDAELVRV